RHYFFSLRRRPPSRSSLFPYTTLFRSRKPGVYDSCRYSFVPIFFAKSSATGTVFLPVSDWRKEEIAVFNGCTEEFARELLLGNLDRKSTRLNSSHRTISYAVFCLKKKK